MSKEEEIGTLIVVVLKAQNLQDKHSFWKQDVYATATLNGVTKKTRVEVKGGQHPVWDEELRFPVLKGTTEKFRVLEVACYAKEARSDDLLGTGKVKIEETLHTGEFDDWVKLDTNGVQRGDLYLEMTYFSSGPPPPMSPTTASSGNSLLAPPQKSNLVRRPSKLPATERLSGPPPSLTPHRPSQGGGGGDTHHSRPSSAGKKDEHPTSPGRIPSALAAGRPQPQHHNTNHPQSPAQVSHTQSISVPALLRPGGPGGGSSPTHGQNGGNSHGRIPSASPPSTGTMPGGYPNSPPHSSHSQTYSPPGRVASQVAQPAHHTTYPINTTHVSHTPTPGLTSPYVQSPPNTISSHNPWEASEPLGSISFPVPMPGIGGPAPNPYDYRSASAAPPGPLYDPRPPMNLYQSPPPVSNLPDPYLQARYQTPLPLPPSPTSYNSYSTSSSSSSSSYYPNSPSNSSSHSNSHQRTPSPPRLPPRRDPTPPPKRRSSYEDRAIALQLAELEAFKRKEQEDKDLELALKLDREFNLS